MFSITQGLSGTLILVEGSALWNAGQEKLDLLMASQAACFNFQPEKYAFVRDENEEDYPMSYVITSTWKKWNETAWPITQAVTELLQRQATIASEDEDEIDDILIMMDAREMFG